MKKIQRSTLFLILTLCLSASAFAQTAEQSWRQAQQAFAASDYEVALEHFQAAKVAGQTGPAVDYNIGASQYKLGDYDAAKVTFTHLDRSYPKLRSLAQYNLGLIANKQAEKEQAVEHFRSSYYSAGDDKKLRALSSTMLRRLIGERVVSAKWFRGFSARAGYDDNVALVDDSAALSSLTTDSPFLQAFATLQGPYTSAIGFRFDSSAFLLRYADASDYNQLGLTVGAIYDYRYESVKLQFRAHVGATSLGGDAYDRNVKLSARITHQFDLANAISLRARHAEISAANDLFAGIEGSRQQLDLRYRWYADGHGFTATLGSEKNDRQDASLSPDRRTLDLRYAYAPERGWGLTIAGGSRTSDYTVATLGREETLRDLSAELNYRFASGWQASAYVSREDNDSDDPLYAYERNRISLGVFRFF